MLLEDDKGIQPAQNLTPAVNADFLADNPDLEEVFNELSAALTTEDLAAMNLAVDVERQKAEDVAAQFLEDKGLLWAHEPTRQEMTETTVNQGPATGSTMIRLDRRREDLRRRHRRRPRARPRRRAR